MRQPGLFLGLQPPDAGGLLYTFATPGLVTLPPWLQFSCASTRNVEIVPNTLTKGIAVNQAVAGLFGLVHEVTDTNYTSYSENFSLAPWTLNAAPTVTYNVSDPAGGTTAMRVQSVGGASEIYQNTLTAPFSTTHNISAYILGDGAASYSLFTSAATAATTYGVTPTTWTRKSAQYNGASIQNFYNVMGASNGNGVPNIATDAKYAFVQYSMLPWLTTYITNNTVGSAVTRAASLLSTNAMPASNNFELTYSYINILPSASYASPTGHIILSNIDSSKYVSLTTNGIIRAVSGTIVNGVNPTSMPGNGEIVTVKIRVTGTSYKITTYVNSVQQNQETLAMSSGWTTGSSTGYLGSAFDGSVGMPQAGVKSIGLVSL